MMRLLFFTLGAFCIGAASILFAENWAPVENAMLSTWGEQLDPTSVWQEYPRPQMERENWMNLNGLWDYAVTTKDGKQPSVWDGDILVPFAIEAPLSGVGRRLGSNEALWYSRSVDLVKKRNECTLLHFEAVDYACEVWLNGHNVGSHVGGNLPFNFDVTAAVKTGSNKLIVKVVDATDEPGTYQLRGKQTKDLDRRIFYTPVSGIWQTVWIEQVPVNYIRALKIDTKVSGEISIQADVAGSGKLRTTAFFAGEEVAQGSTILTIASPALWSPDAPNLYDLKVELIDESGAVVDVVRSYAGIREVSKIKDEQGDWRLTLNGEVIFHWGPLDQGWWPDGLLTPPSDEAMLFDMKYLKAAGFNMVRKHIKVEPRRYYYHCDKMGLLVWQDQLSGGTSQKNAEWPRWKRLRPAKPGKEMKPGTPLDGDWPDWAHEQWMYEFKGMVDTLYNHPSIVVWTPFNERWGQHRTMKVGQWIVDYDPTRSVNIASGGNFFPIGDIADEHSYPHPEFLTDNAEFNDYVKVVGEFGGHGWPVQGHQWKLAKENWGYGGLPKSLEELYGRYADSLRILNELQGNGVAAGVYTQTTDVEGEVNGLITYDRKVIKFPAAKLKEMHEVLGL